MQNAIVVSIVGSINNFVLPGNEIPVSLKKDMYGILTALYFNA